MSNFLKAFETNKKFEEKGVELHFAEASFFVRRAGKSNKAYTVSVSKYLKRNRFQIDNDMLDETEATKELAEIFFNTVVINWENVTDPKTNESLEFNKENFVRLMVGYPEFFDLLRDECQKRANFQDIADEEDAKN